MTQKKNTKPEEDKTNWEIIATHHMKVGEPESTQSWSLETWAILIFSLSLAETITAPLKYGDRLADAASGWEDPVPVGKLRWLILNTVLPWV